MRDFYWIPAVTVLGCGWAWLYGNRSSLKPLHIRGWIGIVGLSLATVASVSLLAAVIHSWVIGWFTWSTPFFDGSLFGLAAVPTGAFAKGRLRLFTIAGAVLSVLGWWFYLAARRVAL